MRDRAEVMLRGLATPPVLAALLALALLLGAGAAAMALTSNHEDAQAVRITPVEPGPGSHAPAADFTTTTPAPAPSAGPSAATSPSPSASVPPTARATSTSTASATTAPPPISTDTATPPTVPTTSAPTLNVAAPIIQAPLSVGVGEAFQLRVVAPGATSVLVELDGARYQLAQAGERFWGIIGIPLGTSPGLRTLKATARNQVGAALASSEAPLHFAPVDRPVDYLQLTDEQSAVVTEDNAAVENALRSAQFAHFDPARRWTGRFLRPHQGFQTTAFGEGRSINGGPVGGLHTGEDIAGDPGDAVIASASGRVAWVGDMPIRGRTVILDHGAGVKTGYNHLEAWLVSEGDMVSAGQIIARVGSTGLSTGPHLHWELSVWGVNVDPEQWTVTLFDP